MIRVPSENKFLQLTTTIGRRIFQQFWILIIVGLFLSLFDQEHLSKICKPKPDKQKSEWYCFVTPLVGNIGLSFLEVSVIVWFFEIGAKREMMKEMEKIVQAAESLKGLKAFHRSRIDYSHKIQESFVNLKAHQTIRLLSLVEDTHIFSDNIGMSKIRDRIFAGCRFEILILHPQSSLLACLQKVGFTAQSHGTLSSKLKELVRIINKEITRNENMSGSIEIRVHKDLFSPVGYFSDSSTSNYIWMYFSDVDDGIEYPAFQISDENLIKAANKHFENIWERASGDGILLKIEKSRISHNRIPILDGN